MENPSQELEELRREVAYLRRLTEQTTAQMLRLDSDSVTIRHELEEKRRGFRLLSDLTATHAGRVDYSSLFISVSRRINAALGMQRTVVLVPEAGGVFKPAVLQGYPAGEEAALAECALVLPPEFLSPDTPVLITGADSPERFAAVREALALPFMIAAPIFLQDEIVAVLITGRLLEQRPYLPALGQSNVETVQAVASHLASLFSGRLLAEAEQRTQIMLDAMPFCCNFWDENHNNVDCNEAAMRLFDVSSKVEYLEKFPQLSPEYQLNGRLSSEYQAERVSEAFSDGYTRFEWMHQKLNGEPIPAEITLVRVKWGKSYIVVSYTRDLREQKALLAEMQKTQDELRLARDVAEQSAKAKSEFLANMSHEIRTPMNAILGMAYLLGRTEITEKQRGYLEQAEHSANLLLRIINDILDFARLDSGRMEFDISEFSLRQLMRHIHDIVRGEAGPKDLKLYTDIDNRVEDTLTGDPIRLEQVLLNLANNAVKFTPPGGKVYIRVRRQDGEDGSPRLLFEVEDTGIGMNAEQVARLFTPFSQADTSATRRYGGMGLGLAVSRRLVAMMGGELVCRSVEGRGSVFSFVLDVPRPGAESEAERSAEADGASADDVLRGMRVLLAEDNDINQMIAEELLAAKGILVRTVDTGQDAVNALAEETFDLVLMDIQMPVMDGLTATVLIRSNPKLADLPVIAMTAHAMTGDREVSLASGMNDHITKPIDPEVLYATLVRWGNRTRR